MFNKDADFAIFFHTVGEEAGGTASPGAAFYFIAHHAHGDMHFALHFRL